MLQRRVSLVCYVLLDVSTKILYGAINLIDYGSGFGANTRDTTIFSTPFPKFTIMLIVCILIMLVHVLFHPYKKKGLNILDSFILVTIVGFLVSALEIYWNKMAGVVLWFLPLVILINYLTFFTKLKYLIIPCSSAALFSGTLVFVHYIGMGTFEIFFLASSSFVLILYIIYVLKCLYARYRRARPRYSAINEQNDEVDENDNTYIAEVSAFNSGPFFCIAKCSC